MSAPSKLTHLTSSSRQAPGSLDRLREGDRLPLHWKSGGQDTGLRLDWHREEAASPLLEDTESASATTVNTAVLLAAGTGSRLRPATDAVPKCLSEVNGVPILEQQMRCLRHWGFHRLIMVVGHLEHQIRDFLDRAETGLTIHYVVNPRYRTTNNIYSLWLAQEQISESFLLLECDLFFKETSLRGMLEPNKVAVSRVQPWMRGTTVDVDEDSRITGFKVGHHAQRFDSKTVNIYSFSAETWAEMQRRLEQRIRSGDVDDYYEVVLSEMVSDGDRSFEAVNFQARDWHEIDTLDDLHAAERAVTTSAWT
jgi:choline kinase